MEKCRFTKTEAAAYLGISVGTLDGYRRDGLLNPPLIPGVCKKVYFLKSNLDELARYLDERAFVNCEPGMSNGEKAGVTMASPASKVITQK